MNIQVYIDETGPETLDGIHNGTLEWAGVGGYISKRHEWEELSVKWQSVLTEFKVEYFHFSEFANISRGTNDPNWHYKHLGKDDRHRFLMKLASIAFQHTQRGIAVLVHVPSYYEIMPKWYQDYRKLPQALCLRAFLAAIWGDVQEGSFLSKQKKPEGFLPAAFFFDRVDRRSHPHWYSQINDLFDAEKEASIKGIESTPFSTLIGDITITDGENHSQPSKNPLESTDLLSYRARQVLDRFPKGPKELDDALCKNISIYSFDAPHLRALAQEIKTNKDAYLCKKIYGD